MKSIEGGTGFSTISKNIIVYKKNRFPIRFYDVKGIENEETLDNYANILKELNPDKLCASDSIHSIFYCKEYTNGTVVEEMENRIFKKLINCQIPIYFIITKTPYDASRKSMNPNIENKRKNQESIIENALYDLIKTLFNEREDDAQRFIENYIKIYYVNLINTESAEPPIPAFGIDKVLSSFSELVPEKLWNEQELACNEMNEEKCKNLLKKNKILSHYSDLENLNINNQREAKEYLKKLKAGAFFSGMIPLFDIWMEYIYKSLFKNKLKSLYGFDLVQAEKALNESNKDNLNKKGSELNKLYYYLLCINSIKIFIYFCLFLVFILSNISALLKFKKI